MTTETQKLSFLIEHQSIPAALLSEPAPNEAQLNLILQSAMSAPDHGYLRPFRFLTIQGKARLELSKVFEQAARNRNLDEDAVQKQKSKPLRSPLIICVIASTTQNPKIPEIEQLLSAGCAAQHIQLACKGLGFASIWLTGDNCYDQHVYHSLGLDLNERLVGFIYIGSHHSEATPKARPSAMDITQSWTTINSPEFAI